MLNEVEQRSSAAHRINGGSTHGSCATEQPAESRECSAPGGEGSRLELEQLCRSLIARTGEDPDRHGLLRTPHRYLKAFEDMTNGYKMSIDEIVNGALFEEPYSEMVIVKDIEFYSLCEHHLLPFFGRAHVAYIPDGRIIGLSKIPRIVQMFARRLQVQERLTHQITEAFVELLRPRGVACMVEGSHMCMMMRGIQTQSASMITSSLHGDFQDNQATRDEFMKLVSSPSTR